MDNKIDPRMKALIDYSTGTTTQDLIDHVLEKRAPSAFNCVVCGGGEVRFIGTDEQLFIFGLPAILTDNPNDTRQYLVSVAECFNCGYLHLFAPGYASARKKKKEAEGNV
ncbi:hypothetical protein OR620_07740 [Aeromonas hydrophila]|uniref:hypothetical protein n=1 Tax=Aeromonas hydrophila TaxID=644 RepID=UPI00111B7762|nr:hypothetical protein [Aeromonas hydrophila]MCX4103671.1 hypothetical protein [Aeromonas hydrophila]